MTRDLLFAFEGWVLVFVAQGAALFAGPGAFMVVRICCHSEESSQLDDEESAFAF